MLPTGALAGAALDATTKAVAELAKAFGGLSTALREITRVVGEFTPLLGKIGDAFLRLGAQIKSVVVSAFGLLTDALRPMTDRLKYAADVVRFAVGGAFGALADAAKPVTDKVGSAGRAVTAFVGVIAAKFTKIGSAVADWLKPFTQAIGFVFSKLGDTEAVWKPLTRGLTGVGKAAGAAIVGLGVVAAGLVMAGNLMATFVAKANPVVAEQFTTAVNDLMAVMGQSLVPIFRIVTDLVKAAGDTFLSFQKDINSVLAEILTPLAQILKEVFSIIGLVGMAMASVMKTIGPILAGILQMIADAVSWVMRLVEDLLGVTGRREGAATGAAVRSASTTDVESVLKKARESAYSLGTASREDPARATVDILGAIRGKMTDLVEAVKGLPERIATAIATGAVDFADDVVDTLGDVKNAILDFGGSALETVGLRDRPADTPIGPALLSAEAFRARMGAAGAGVVAAP